MPLICTIGYILILGMQRRKHLGSDMWLAQRFLSSEQGARIQSVIGPSPGTIRFLGLTWALL